MRGHVSASISEIIMALKCLYASPICISIRNSSNVSGRSSVCAVCVSACVCELCVCALPVRGCRVSVVVTFSRLMSLSNESWPAFSTRDAMNNV